MSGFSGMDDLINDLGKLGEMVIAEVAEPALRVAGRAAVAIAQANSPVVSGRFRGSIHMGGEAGAGAGEKDMGPEPSTGKSAAVAVGSQLFYANFVEFGAPHNAAKYVVGNAVEQAGDRVLEDALLHYMDEAARKAGF